MYEKKITCKPLLRDEVPPRTGSIRFPGVDYYGRRSVYAFESDLLYRGLLVIGDPRRGKTNVIKRTVRELQREGIPTKIVCLDVKGEYAEEFLRPGDMVVGTSPGPSCPFRWNIFYGILLKDDGTPDFTEVHQAIESLFEPQKSQTQPFFAEAGRMVVEGLVRALFFESVNGRISPDRLNNMTLRDWLLNAPLSDIQALLSRYAETRAAADLLSTGHDTAISVLAEVRLFADRVFIKAFAEAPPDGYGFTGRSLLRTAIENNSNIFLEVDASLPHTYGVFSAILEEMFEALLDRHFFYPQERIIFILDEYSFLPPAKSLLSCLALCGYKRVGFLVGLQLFDQIERAAATIEHGESAKSAAAVFFSSMQSVISLSCNDASLTKALNERLGLVLVQQEVTSTEKSPQVNIVERYPLRQSDIRTSKVGCATIAQAGAPAFLFRFDDYSDEGGHDQRVN